MSGSYQYTQRWRLKAKLWAIQYAGGKCQCCGYQRYYGNLAFHHVDRDSKADTVNKLIKETASWDRILAEINKCVLVCTNCHGEIHADIKECPAINHSERAVALATIKTCRPTTERSDRTPRHKCARCGCQLKTGKRFCTHACSRRDREVIAWPDNLPQLVETTSKRSVAISLGVSDKAVAKRLRHHH